jgi:hypothetical protein
VAARLRQNGVQRLYVTLNPAVILQRLKSFERSSIVKRFAREAVQKPVVTEQEWIAIEEIWYWKANLTPHADRRQTLQMRRAYVLREVTLPDRLEACAKVDLSAWLQDGKRRWFRSCSRCLRLFASGGAWLRFRHIRV